MGWSRNASSHFFSARAVDCDSWSPVPGWKYCSRLPSLVAVNIDGQVVIGGAPVSVGTVIWPAQARQLAGC